MEFDGLRIAVCIPCFNEEVTVASVVKRFRNALPSAAIYVYDNNSTDRTVEVARASGAFVRSETQQGKGHVVRRMFADIDADIYVMADGDDTYHAESVAALIALMLSGPFDLVNGARVTPSKEAYRRGHRFGNAMLTFMVGFLFGHRSEDMLSGYKVFSRRFVKSFPASSGGFDIETELLVHALELGMPISEIPTPYGDRPAGSASKLRTYSDGFRILFRIVELVRQEKPLVFFGVIAMVMAAGALLLGAPVVEEFIATGLVPKLPTAVLAASIGILSALSFSAGLILDLVQTGRHEAKKLFYLGIPAPPHRPIM